jgi:hypothetical protein
MSRALRIGHAFVIAGGLAFRVSAAAAQPAPAAPAPAPKDSAAAAPTTAATPPKDGATAAEQAPPAEAPPKEAAPVEPPAAVAPSATPAAAAVAVQPQSAQPPPQKDVVAPAPAKAPEPKNPSSLEISGAIGPSILTSEAPANPEYTQNYNRVGLFAEVALALRSKYFLDPYLAVSYAMLASGESALPAGPWGAGGTLDQHLFAWTVSPGITTDIWRIRLRYGVGFSFVNQSFDFLDQHNTSTQFVLSHELGIGANLLDVDRFRMDVEMRFVAMPGADITFPTLTVVARGDLIFFGPRQ